MANIRSAAKAARKGKRREAVNVARKSRVRTFVRSVEEAIASGDSKAAVEALRAAQPEIIRGANKRILHKRAAARKVSRLTRRVKALSK
ncbi:MAG: 30S ribosomal protein S20 [Alphaproteobacteria bacterium]|nr:30S ribosomal protein S20 [Alphaproteobacteria bacterium]